MSAIKIMSAIQLIPRPVLAAGDRWARSLRFRHCETLQTDRGHVTLPPACLPVLRYHRPHLPPPQRICGARWERPQRQQSPGAPSEELQLQLQLFEIAFFFLFNPPFFIPPSPLSNASAEHCRSQLDEVRGRAPSTH